MTDAIKLRLDKWCDKLVDLTKRNKLLNFKLPSKSDKPLRTATIIEISNASTLEIYNSLVELKNLSIIPEKKEDPSKEKIINTEFNVVESSINKSILKLQAKYLDKEKLLRNLSRIRTEALSAIEEQGNNILFIALGFLEYYEHKISEAPFYAPLILVPIEIKKGTVGNSFTIKYTGEVKRFNSALKLQLKKEFNIDLSDIDMEAENIDIMQVFLSIQEKIDQASHSDNSLDRCKVLKNDINIALFSFAKFVMYEDLKENIEKINSNETINLLCKKIEDIEYSENLCSDGEIEEKNSAYNIMQILEADSSQQKAIAIAKSNNHLVIEGPPGTGKSQTIANIIAELLAQDKKVLFVSQKIAALQVVESRLKSKGLNIYCLELHDNKSNKKAIIEQLEESLKIMASELNITNANLAELETLKKQLNSYVTELHLPYGKLGFSAYKAMGIISNNTDVVELSYAPASMLLYDEATFKDVEHLLETIGVALSKIGRPEEYPWYNTTVALPLSHIFKNQLKEIFEKIINKYKCLSKTSKELAEYIHTIAPNSLNEIEKLIEASEVVFNLQNAAIKYFCNTNKDDIIKDINLIDNLIKEYNSYYKDFNNNYKLTDILNENLDTISHRFSKNANSLFAFLKPAFWQDKKFIKSYIIPTYKPTKSQLAVDIVLLNNMQHLTVKVESVHLKANDLFCNIWSGVKSNVDDIFVRTKHLHKFQRLLDENYIDKALLNKADDNQIDISLIKELKYRVVSEFNELKDAIDKLIELSIFNLNEFFGCNKENINLSSLNKKISAMYSSLNNLDEWFNYISLVENPEYEIYKINEFLQKCFIKNVLNDDIARTFKVEFLRHWLDKVFNENKSLQKFIGYNHEELITKFKKLDLEQKNWAKIKLFNKLSSKVTQLYENKAARTEINILEREIKKKRHKPLRKLFKELPTVLQTLKPCMMMSPMSVSQYLDSNIHNFDVVIFDEASQLLTEECIGAVYRSNKIIVAGDSKQLPPTNFFSAYNDDGDDEAEESDNKNDLESFLDECSTSGLPKTTLQWHYRSKHEDLIAFSNRHIYRNKLLTFPSPINEVKSINTDNNESGIKFYNFAAENHINTDNGNLEEAKKVAQAIIQHFKYNKEKSLGVATFNIKQKVAIDDALEKLKDELRKELNDEDKSSLETFFSRDKEEHFFTKNIESIQGDERDIIFISVGYTKKDDKLSMNFGPINKAGGERRLNVLITRARERIDIFSSIRSEDFKETQSKGVILLRDYLDFAENGFTKEQISSSNDNADFDSEFEKAVHDALEDKGYKLKLQVGCSNYRIDLAVINPNNPNRYLLGIECDGKTYHSSRTARDRDRLRQEVLEGLGWKIYRIWSTDWFRNSKREIEKLVKVIEDCRNINNNMTY